MIHYSLICENNHKFEAWFRNSDSFLEQSKAGIVSCPLCSSQNVQKALMAPAISSARKSTDKNIGQNEDNGSASRPEEKFSVSAGHPQQEELRAAIKKLRDIVTKEADYVGDKFAIEARKIHDQLVEPRKIYGEATKEEISSLLEDGIDFLPLPTLPEEHN